MDSIKKKNVMRAIQNLYGVLSLSYDKTNDKRK